MEGLGLYTPVPPHLGHFASSSLVVYIFVIILVQSKGQYSSGLLQGCKQGTYWVSFNKRGVLDCLWFHQSCPLFKKQQRFVDWTINRVILCLENQTQTVKDKVLRLGGGKKLPRTSTGIKLIGDLLAVRQECVDHFGQVKLVLLSRTCWR